jgi:hypothetical protein
VNLLAVPHEPDLLEAAFHKCAKRFTQRFLVMHHNQDFEPMGVGASRDLNRFDSLGLSSNADDPHLVLSTVATEFVCGLW